MNTSVQRVSNDDGKLDELHRDILEKLEEGRATPKYLADHLGESRQLISNRLRDLRMGGHVTKVHKGLYELADDADVDDGPAETDDEDQSDDSADTERRVSEQVDEPDDNEPTREREPERKSEPEPIVDDTSAHAADAVATAVDRVSENWDDTEERMEARRAAARAVLQHAVDTGDAVGKGEAIDQFLPEHAVDGQGDETWWRKNIRPVLKAVGEYSNGRHGYLVREDDLDEFLGEGE